MSGRTFKRALSGAAFLLIFLLPGPAGATPIYEAARKVLEGREPSDGVGLSDRVVQARKSAEKSESKALESLLTGGASIAYGKLLSNAQKSGMARFSAEAWKGGQVARDLARANRWRGYTGKLNTAVGRAAGVVRIGGALYKGETDEAAIAGVTMVLSELPNLPGGPGLMKLAGISAPMISAAVLTYHIWQASEQALAEARAGVHLQSLFYTIERMCRDRDRELGLGDPIPVSRENVEKVWKRLLTDRNFQESFRSYVVEELNEEFPETGRLRSVADAFYTFGGEQTSEDMQQRRLESELIELETQMKAYISGILRRLNRYWLAREHGVIAVKVGRALEGDIDRASRTLESGLGRVAYAAERLDYVTGYAERSRQRVDKAAEEGDFRRLMTIRRNIYDYVENVIAWIPDGEPLGDEKYSTFELLRETYVAAGKALIGIRESIRERMEKPQFEEPEYEEVPITARMLYESHMIPVIEEWPEFDWGWTEDADTAVKDLREHFLELFQNGRREAMENSIRAWEEWELSRAMEDLTGVSGTDILSGEAETADNYRNKLISIRVEPPPELADGSGYSAQEKRYIREEWNKARQMYRSAAELKAELLRQRHFEALDWMEKTYESYLELLSDIEDRAAQIRRQVWVGYGLLAPEESPHESLSGARRSREESRYTGPPQYRDPPGENPFTAAQNYLRRKRHEIETRLGYIEQGVEGMIMDHERGIREFDAALAGAEPDMEEIRRHYDSEFLTDTYYILEPDPRRRTYEGGVNFAQARSRRNRTPGYISSLRSRGAQLTSGMQQDIDNIDLAWFWVLRAEEDYDRFMDMRRDFFLIPDLGWYGREFYEFGGYYEGDYTLLSGRVPVRRGEETVEESYYLFLSREDRNRALSDLRAFYRSSYLKGFIEQVALYRKPGFDRFFLELSGAEVYPHENFFIPMDPGNFHYGTLEKEFITYRSYGLVDAAGVRAARQILDEFDPAEGMRIDETLYRMQAKVPLPAFYPERRIWIENFPAQDSPLGKKYVSLMEDISSKWQETHRIAAEGHTGETRAAPAQPPSEKEDDISGRAEEFYREFKRAYESGNDVRIISMLDDNWSSADGTRLAEAENHLRRMFGLFDSISYDISDLSVSRSGDLIRAEYDLSIEGRIFRSNITHRERSSVTEDLREDSSGRLRIIRTLRGRFWTE